jgi:antitoxin component YwqK of YwqJK toxin-antitoxin module
MPLKNKIYLGLLLLLCACHPGKPEEDLVLIQIQDRNGLSETISNPDRLATYHTTDFLSSQPYQKVLRVFRKEGKNRSIVTTYHPNGSTWQLLEAKEMRAFGSYREWFASGAQKIEALVIGGNADLTPSAQETWLFDGISSVWDEEGHLLASIQYDKGVLSGLSTYYYPSGSIEKTVPHLQNRIDGEMQEFWKNGQIKTKSFYRNGQKEGPCISFWPSGERRAEENYQEGRLQSGRYWTISQQIVSEVIEEAGFQAIFHDLHLAQLQEIRNGVAEGLVKNFTPLGELRSIYNLKNGKKHGEEIEYYSSHEIDAKPLLPKISLSWDQDAIHGIVKTWYPNGQLQSQREMCRNKRNGVCCCWYRDGSLMLTEEYDSDELVRGKYYRKNQFEPISSVANGNGTASIYDEDGVFLRKVIYFNRKIVDPE